MDNNGNEISPQQLSERQRAEKIKKEQTLGVYDNDEDLTRDSAFNDGFVEGYEEGYIAGAKENEEQLKQAKEIIKTFLQLRNGKVLDCCKDKECPCENPLCETINERAEQFLKEIEK